MTIYILYINLVLAECLRLTRERRAKIFWKGRRQVVRLPKGFRFEGDEVEITRVGDAVILEPLGRRGVAGWMPVSPFDMLPRYNDAALAAELEEEFGDDYGEEYGEEFSE